MCYYLDSSNMHVTLYILVFYNANFLSSVVVPYCEVHSVQSRSEPKQQNIKTDCFSFASCLPGWRNVPHKEIFFLYKTSMFSVGEGTLLSYHKIRKADEIEKDFCIIIF